MHIELGHAIDFTHLEHRAEQRAEGRAHERFRRLGLELDRAVDEAHPGLSATSRGLLRDVRRLGAEVARTLARVPPTASSRAVRPL